MTTAERARTIHGHLFRYSADRLELEDYYEQAFRKNGKHREAGVRGSFVSDPTARGGVMLAHLPPVLRIKADWCAAIEDALVECKVEDGDNLTGLAYIMKEYFCLFKEPRPKAKNGEAVDAICAACGIHHRSGFYSKVSKITDIVMYHAAKRKLI